MSRSPIAAATTTQSTVAVCRCARLGLESQPGLSYKPLIMSRAKVWRRACAILVAVWCVTLPTVWALREARPTAAKTIAFVEAHPLGSRPTEERARIVDEFGSRLNRLSFAERQQAQFHASVRAFYRQMTEEERNRCWQFTLSIGMGEMIEAFNRMTPEGRKRHLSKAIAELDLVLDEGRDPEFVISEADRNWIINEGLTRYLAETDATTRLELQPVIERVQNILQMAR